MSEELTLKYIPLTQAKRWDRNPKRHDVGAICRSIELHGFRDPPAYDAALDAFVEGNGRTDALEALWQQKRPAPRGIAVLEDGGWALPVIFGVDAVSRAAAEAYGVDHNNLTLSGGDFTAWDMAKLWDQEAYTSLLAELAADDLMPASVDGDDLDALLGGMAEPDDLWKGMPEFEQEDKSWKMLRVYFANADDYADFQRLIGQSLTDKTTFIWHPEQAPEDLTIYRVEDES